MRPSNTLSLFGLACILLPIFFYNPETPFPGVYALPPVVGTAAIILFANSNNILAKILSARPLVFIGLISYSVYLWHQPVMVYFRLESQENHLSYSTAIIAIFLTFALAFLTYRLVEKPFRLGFKSKRQNSLQFAFLNLVVISVLATTALLSSINTGRMFFDADEAALMQSIKRSRTQSCSNPETLCKRRSSDKVDILLVGDSNAYHFSSALQSIADEKAATLVNLTLGGCLPLSSFFRLDQDSAFNRKCIDFNQSVLSTIEKSPVQGTIIISAAWHIYLYGNEYFSAESEQLSINPVSKAQLSLNGVTPLTKLQRNDAFWDYFETMLSLVANDQTKVIVIGPIPPALTKFEDRTSLLAPKPSRTQSFAPYNRPFEKKIRELQRRFQFTYIAPANEICDQLTCRIVANGKYLYGDPIHFSNYGQNFIMKPLLYKALEN